MKRETMEKWVLLNDAGELGIIRRWRLNRALARQPELQAWRQEVTGLCEWARRTADPVPATPRDVLAAIMQAGEQSRTPANHASGVRNPAWAMAALLVLGLAAWMTLLRPSSAPLAQASARSLPSTAPSLAWEDGLDNQMADLYARLDTARENGTDSSSSADELDAMASELLDEGSQI